MGYIELVMINYLQLNYAWSIKALIKHPSCEKFILSRFMVFTKMKWSIYHFHLSLLLWRLKFLLTGSPAHSLNEAYCFQLSCCQVQGSVILTPIQSVERINIIVENYLHVTISFSDNSPLPLSARSTLVSKSILSLIPKFNTWGRMSRRLPTTVSENRTT